jgi:hypothetical protein
MLDEALCDERHLVTNLRFGHQSHLATPCACFSSWLRDTSAGSIIPKPALGPIVGLFLIGARSAVLGPCLLHSTTDASVLTRKTGARIQSVTSPAPAIGTGPATIAGG